MKFILLAGVLSLFVYKDDSSIEEWAFGIGFLFVSFLVFRMLDDAGSVHLDRVNHPDRTYLNKVSYARFVVLTSIVCTAYLIALCFYSTTALLIIGSLMLVSIVFYLLLGKSKFILPVIPLLKYPVLVWCLFDFTDVSELICVAVSTLFMLASHDLIENIGKKKAAFPMSLLVVFITGYLLYQPWVDALNVLYILPMLVVIRFIGNWKFSQYIPLLYYPVTYFLIYSMS
ncbi:MAG: hypothetical protein JKY54_14490 [Flavobacteriales bacterium]|nr:hypothetical protein [Flavobacteriales bacterium]